MARKPKPLEFEGETRWLDTSKAAYLLATTKPKIVARALAGEFRYIANRYGKPRLISETDVAAPLAAKRAVDDAKLAAERANPKPKRERVYKPREKTPAQWEAHWARIAAKNASLDRAGGMFQQHHLRLTLPHEKAEILDPKKWK